jgi:hypothetical protein
MEAFIQHNEYLVAWSIYILAGLGCNVVWWKITSFIDNRGWRDLSRGMVIVMIFTPWFADESRSVYAPALIVLVMDMLLEGAKGGLHGGLALLISLFVMLLALTLGLVFRRRRPADI